MCAIRIQWERTRGACPDGEYYDSGFFGGEELDKAAWRVTFKPSGWNCTEKDPKDPKCAKKPT